MTKLRCTGEGCICEEQAAGEQSTGIIGLLEVIESDFSANPAEITATEENAAVNVSDSPRRTRLLGAKKEKDVEYKTKEAGSLDQAVTSCLSTGMVCSQNTMPFIRTWASSRNSASLSQRRMLHAKCVERPSACHRTRLLNRAKDEQETPTSTRNCVRARKPVNRVLSVVEALEVTVQASSIGIRDCRPRRSLEGRQCGLRKVRAETCGSY